VGGEKKGAAFSWPTEKNTKKKIKKNVKNLTGKARKNGCLQLADRKRT
jgi:hypothetical protein